MQETPAIPYCLYEELKRLAKASDTSNYKAVAVRCDIGPHEMRFGSLVRLLTAVNEQEHTRGAPLLASVVVNKKSGMPGPGFFAWARDNILIHGSDKEFWESELERVRDYWADSAPSPIENPGRSPNSQTAKPPLHRILSPMTLVRSLFARL